jgi:hypothetical protein
MTGPGSATAFRGGRNPRMGLGLVRAFADRRFGMALRGWVRFLGDGGLLRWRRILTGGRRFGRGMGGLVRLLRARA